MTTATTLSKTEKLLFIAVCIFAAVLLGIAYWHYTLEINPVISLPVLVLPHPNAREYYTRAGEKIGDLQVTVGGRNCTYGIDELESLCGTSENSRVAAKLPVASSQPAPTWGIAETFVSRQAPAVATLHQGFTSDFYALPPTSYGKSTFARELALTLNNGEYRKLARVLALTGRVKAHQGDWTGATESDLDAVQLGAEIQHGGCSTCIIGAACQSIGRAGAWAAIPQLSGAQARAAARRMETLIARTPPFANIMQEEKYATLAWLNAVFHKPGWRKEVFATDSNCYNFRDSLQISVYSKRDVVQQFISMMDLGIAWARQPYNALTAGRTMALYSLFSLAPLEMVTDARCTFTSNDTQNAMLLISYALQAYHAEHGRYPGQA